MSNIKGNTRRIAGVHLEPRRPRPDPRILVRDSEQHHLRELALMDPASRSSRVRMPVVTAFLRLEKTDG